MASNYKYTRLTGTDQTVVEARSRSSPAISSTTTTSSTATGITGINVPSHFTNRQSSGKKVYVFGDGTIHTDDSENVELNVLTDRKISQTQRSYKSFGNTAGQYKDVKIAEIPLKNGDTLQNLSVKFRCSISELKRMNGLMTEQDFYALKVIKIPIRPHQHHLGEELSKIVATRKNDRQDTGKIPNGASVVSTSDEEEDDDVEQFSQVQPDRLKMLEPHSDPDDYEAIALLDRDRSHRNNTVNNSKQEKRKLDKFLNRKDQDLERIVDKIESRSGALDEVLSDSDDSPSFSTQQRATWFNLKNLCIVVCVAVVLVLILIAVRMFNSDLNKHE